MSKTQRIADVDVEDFLEIQRNKNTDRKTKYDVNLLTNFLLSSYKEQRPVSQIPPQDLNLVSAIITTCHAIQLPQTPDRTEV